MATVKKSPLTGAIELMLADSKESFRLPPHGTTFFAEDLFGCHRRIALSCSPPLPRHQPSKAEHWRLAFRASRNFKVISENAYLSDSKTGLAARVDLLVEYRDERFVVRFWESDLDTAEPTILQVTDMVVCMYLSLVWSGVIFRHSGEDYRLHFVNPDRKEAKAIVSSAFEAASKLAFSVTSGVPPAGAPAKWCLDCPYMEGCDDYQSSRKKG